MKPQDILFVVVLITLLIGFYKRPAILALFGIVLLFLSIPLFYLWIFFTAQRFVYYAACLFLIAAILMLISERKKR